jgi:hypothetical protein
VTTRPARNVTIWPEVRPVKRERTGGRTYPSPGSSYRPERLPCCAAGFTGFWPPALIVRRCRGLRPRRRVPARDVAPPARRLLYLAPPPATSFPRRTAVATTTLPPEAVAADDRTRPEPSPGDGRRSTPLRHPFTCTSEPHPPTSPAGRLHPGGGRVTFRDGTDATG